MFAALAMACVLSSPGHAMAEPALPVGEVLPLRLITGLDCTTHAGMPLILPPGRYLPENEWLSYSVEHDRLELAEVRLAAENQSLRTSAAAEPAAPAPGGWGTLALIGLAGIAGFAGGVWLMR